MQITKRDGSLEEFNFTKIENAIRAAFKAENSGFTDEEKSIKLVLEVVKNSTDILFTKGEVTVESIQDAVEDALMACGQYKVAKAYILYRANHAEERTIRGRIKYMKNYQINGENAATSSATDPNANMNLKNVANMEAEVYKPDNRKTQRIMLYDEIEKLYNKELAEQYIFDLEHHLIYTHDEASSPVIKNYCEAVTLYPLLEGTGSLDGTSTNAPSHLDSFCGQLVNATFLLASQCKGAVAFGEFFNFFDYFAVKDFGEDYDLHENEFADNPVIVTNPKRIGEKIEQQFQHVVFNWNQPAGNRGAQSPFTNISYYDSNYWKSLFEDFIFPDGSRPKWRRVDYLQKKFMKWFNKTRSETLLTFPVETMALLTDGNDVIDKDYKHFTSKMYAEGHSFFTYLSDNPDSLASCCRLRNQITENTFTFTNGLTGVQTGSCNVITLNLNRLVQDCANKYNYFNNIPLKDRAGLLSTKGKFYEHLKYELTELVERVHKYHIAYKSMLYEWESNGMFTASKAGYISMSKLYSTIGLNGINEAAEFLGIKCNYNQDYIELCQLITGTISELNKKNGTSKFLFNSEFVPAESLSSKNYNWDKNDGYWVPEDRNLYNSYFYLASDPNTSILDRFKLHGREFTGLLDGGVGLHCNLEEHLSQEQYNYLIDYAIKVGCSYFTFNVPNCQCDKCGYIEKHHFDVCPKCNSSETTDWSRIIGYLRPIPKFDKERYKEALTRVYHPKNNLEC